MLVAVVVAVMIVVLHAFPDTHYHPLLEPNYDAQLLGTKSAFQREMEENPYERLEAAILQPLVVSQALFDSVDDEVYLYHQPVKKKARHIERIVHGFLLLQRVKRLHGFASVAAVLQRQGKLRCLEKETNFQSHRS